MDTAKKVLRLTVPLLSAMLAACAGGSASTTPSPAPEVTPQVTTETPADADSSEAPRRVGIGVQPGTGEVMRGSAPAARRTDRQSLTRDEILATEYTNMYDVLLALRGNWMRTRTSESFFGKSSALQVYLDTQRLPGVEELRTLSPRNIESVRYLDPIQASARWGMDHGAGAILITTAKR